MSANKKNRRSNYNELKKSSTTKMFGQSKGKIKSVFKSIAVSSSWLMKVMLWPFRTFAFILAKISVLFASSSSEGYISKRTGNWVENRNYGKSQEWIEAKHIEEWTIFLVIIFIVWIMYR